MSPTLVDSHCHLDLLDLAPFGGHLEGVLDDANAHGVRHILCAGVTLDAVPRILDIVHRHPRVVASVGLHPNERVSEEPDEEALARLARQEGVVAIGETGLDYYRSQGDLTWQRDRFRRHIAAARASGLPLVIHSRNAAADTLKMLAEEGARDVGGVMHCFAEDWEVARRAMDLGFLISLSGIVTFPKAQALHEVARRVPLDRLMLETDAPWLAPVPHRGQPNRPAYVRHVAEQVARLRDDSLDGVAGATTDNFFRLFRRAVPRGGPERDPGAGG
jgi:TatD DNase family protein